jgi:hypothetical protein
MPWHITAEENGIWMLRGDLGNQPAADSGVGSFCCRRISKTHIPVINNRQRLVRMSLVDME